MIKQFERWGSCANAYFEAFIAMKISEKFQFKFLNCRREYNLPSGTKRVRICLVCKRNEKLREKNMAITKP